jgi:hypothetical protein
MERKLTFEEADIGVIGSYGHVIKPSTCLKPQQDEDAASHSQKDYRCAFCGFDTFTARQVEKFGSNLVCTLCKKECKDRGIPLDLTYEEALRIYEDKKLKVYSGMTENATTITDLQLALIAMPIIENNSFETWQKEMDAKHREWFNHLK